MMTEDYAMKAFFEIHDDIPRGGPGSFASTRRAFFLLTDCPKNPSILDVGCGPGMQTLHLAELSDGWITAVDNHQPFLNRLRAAVKENGLDERIQVINADMTALDFGLQTFDVIWAEGSIYIMGFEKGLRAWKALLKPTGFLAATEISWLKPNPPEVLKAFWESEYPGLQDVETNLKVIRRAGYRLVDHFTLPESDWWENYYKPIQEKLPDIRKKYRDYPDALSVVEMESREIGYYGEYSDYYGYVFYVMKAEG
jgi:ubiquinone/menaquinone biosynthesis C-methylase UbiE